ncbi:hypothetical protein KIL84_016864 [Mauremys mutica]|uniref:Cytochrome P450 n=1 Tax=Mauremys mutica TaxID=74926 RepID=A0A9D4AY53_9SAUR|nr:hypothetical protein KIL84_016864 [Mauremys mutica]
MLYKYYSTSIREPQTQQQKPVWNQQQHFSTSSVIGVGEEMDIDVTDVLALVLGLIIIMYFLFQPRNPNSPPFIRGWIPWFGAAFQFGKAPLKFIEQARNKYGPVFTVYILGNRFTFVTETEDVLEFLKSKETDLDEAVQQAIQRTGTEYSLM